MDVRDKLAHIEGVFAGFDGHLNKRGQARRWEAGNRRFHYSVGAEAEKHEG